MKKRIQKTCIALVLSLFFNMGAFALDVTINGINYTLDVSSRTASVAGSSMENIVVPETIYYDDVIYTVTAIGSYAFGNKTIISIKTGNTIKTLGNQAFAGATNLQIVDFGNALERIDAFCFQGCKNLKYIVLPKSIINIGSNAFEYSPVSIICLKEGFNTTAVSRTIYPSSFFTFDNSITDYNGRVPEANYTFNGIGFGFQPTAVNLDALVATAGNHTSDLIFTIANDDMSFDVDIPYTYTINPVTLTAKVSDASRLYGDSDPQFSSTYTGFVNNEDASVVTSHGSYTPTATVKSDVGKYAIKQTGATAQNYVFEYEDGILTVNKAPLTMTANDKTMTYGGTIPTFDANYEGLKNNENQPVWITAPSLSTIATSASKVGIYPITIDNAEAKNYQLTLNNGTLTIGKAELTVTVDNKDRIYGDANPEFTLSYTGLMNNETVPEWEKQPTVETTASIQSPVGTYPISIKDVVAVNYNITAVDGTLTINKAVLHVTPNDATRNYGEDNPVFELSFVGLKNNESVPEWTIEPVITTSAIKTSSVGEYAIQVTTAEARNYTLEKKTGILTITKAPLTVGVNSYNRKYGEANPTFELYYNGLLNGETAPDWTELPSISTEAGVKSDVGEYEITGTGGVMKNYEAMEITSGILTITPASLTIKANDANRLYFDENPEFSFSCIGLIAGDDTSALTVMPQISTSATKYSNVGLYVLEIGDAESKNYTIGYEKGQLTINKRQLTVSTKNYTRTYGEENPDFEIIYAGFVNNEDESVLISKPKATTEAKVDSDVGVYDITIDNGVAENYDFSYNNGKLTIEKAYQTLTWDQNFNDVKLYDQIELTAIASSGLEITYTIEGDQICSIIRIGNKQYLDCTGEGETVVVAIQEGNNNYWQTTKIYKQITVISTKYKLTYIVDGEVYKTYDVEYGATITPEAEPTKEGYTFSGWSEIPETMPAHDVTVTGTFTPVGDMLDGHEYVDLGLPSGKCWATTNYGSNTPEGYGTYLVWGNNSIISSNWGPDWMTPSFEDIRELQNYCTWVWNSKNGNNGYTVIGENGKSIFLPACGYMMAGQSSAKKVGQWVYYWTSTKSGEMAKIIMCTSSEVGYGEMNTSLTKLPIRPITKKMSSGIKSATPSMGDNLQDIVGVYDMQGHRLNDLSKGINLVKYKDGSTKKIVK